MGEKSNADLEKENEQLKEELREIRLATDGSKAMGFVNLISRYFVIGRNVSESTENLIRKYKRSPLVVHDKEIAEVVSAIVKRMVFVYFLTACLASLPALLLIMQTYLLTKQTRLQTQELEYLAAARDLETVSVLACSLENSDVYLAPDSLVSESPPSMFRTPGRVLEFVVVNNEKHAVALRSLELELGNVFDGSVRVAHPDTYEKENRFVKGLPIDDLKNSICYLNPGIGGDTVAKLNLVLEPAESVVFQCYFPMPFCTKAENCKVSASLSYVGSSAKLESIVLPTYYTEVEKELVISADNTIFAEYLLARESFRKLLAEEIRKRNRLENIELQSVHDWLFQASGAEQPK